MNAAIEIESLSKIFRGRSGDEVEAVSSLDLKVEPGQVFGFLGSNGAGKTTTIKMACGLVLPTTGTVRLNGYDVRTQRGQAMRQIGAVLEGTRNVYWRMNAWQNLLYFGRIKGVSSGKLLRARAETLLRELDLWERRKDPVGEYSRGMQQKVAIAAALMTGMRGAIPASLMGAIRDSGIAHLLAISGLHIGLVAGILFFGIRAGLALIPRLALRQPIKKWAAGGAIAGNQIPSSPSASVRAAP